MKMPSLLVAGAFSLAMLFPDRPTAWALSSDSACAYVSVGIVTGAATVFPGTGIGISGTLRNCSDRKARYTLVVSGVSSCGQRVEISATRLTLGPGENKSWSVSYAMPTNTCSGIWEASVQAHEGRENGDTAASSDRAVASGTATVIVD